MRGFTLIELLVVIAIIGILSAVVLASLNTARQKGNDAAVKSNLATVQTQAQLYYDDQTPVSFGKNVTACTAGVFSDPTITAAITSANNSSIDSSKTVCHTDSTGQDYAISVQMTSKGTLNQFWCVDSTGVEKVETAVLATGANKCL